MLMYGASWVVWKDGEIFNEDELLEHRQKHPLVLDIQEEYEREVAYHTSFYTHLLQMHKKHASLEGDSLLYADASQAYAPLSPTQHEKFLHRAQRKVALRKNAVDNMDKLMNEGGHPVFTTSIQDFNSPLTSIPDNASKDWLDAIEEFCNLVLTADYSKAFAVDSEMRQIPMDPTSTLRGRDSVIEPEPGSAEHERWQKRHHEIYENLDFCEQVLERVAQVRSMAS